jgi:protein-S-isoprenylcysteine O-methyltransferase Ste14
VLVSAAFLQRGGAWVVAQVVLMAAVVVLAWRFRGQELSAGVVWMGGVLLAVGGLFGLAGVRALGRGTTPWPKPSQQSRLVQTGIYARVRHPLYTSVMLVSLGWALVWKSWPALVAALALIPFFHAKARREERWLREQFPDYTDYERRVPRFLPHCHVRRRR